MAAAEAAPSMTPRRRANALRKLDNCEKRNGQMRWKDGCMTSASHHRRESALLLFCSRRRTGQKSLRLERSPLKFTSISIGALVEK